MVAMVLRRGLTRLSLTGIVALAAGCLPPPMSIGYVALDPSGRGGVDIQGQVGAGAEFAGPAGGGGAVGIVEPFATRRFSFPIGVGFGVAGANGSATGLMPLRFGVRHRALRHFSWGLGVGPSLAFSGGGAQVAGVADLELVVGTHLQRVGFSFGFRPAFSFSDRAMTWYGLFEPQLAIPVGRARLTVGLLTGPWVTGTQAGNAAGGFLGVAFGVYRRF